MREFPKRNSKESQREPVNEVAASKFPTVETVITIVDDILKEVPLSDIAGRSWCMYRVPAHMREHNPSAYDPTLISIGPFHHNNPRLDPMQEHKRRLLCRFFDRANNAQSVGGDSSSINGEDDNIMGIASLVLAMKKLERMTRKCYSQDFRYIGSDEFCLMMILDGCFIVELLLEYDDEEFFNEPIIATRWMLRNLKSDLLLLENQLPFFVLKKLLELASEPDHEPSLTEIALNFFNAILPGTSKDRNLKYTGQDDYGPSHLLDLIRPSFLPSKNQSPTRPIIFHEKKLIPCVTELQKAGVTFKKGNDEALLDVNFNNGVLEMPTLFVDDFICPLFLNLMAFEQCHSRGAYSPDITSYIFFLDSLVNSPKDVELLHYNGIIQHVLGSDEEVSHLINRLCKGVVFHYEDCYLSEQLERVKHYNRTRWNLLRAKLIYDYENNRWAFISVLAATILLFLTIIQTFFTIFVYFRPPR